MRHPALMTPPRQDPDFIEALARGLDVIRAFGTTGAPASLSELAHGGVTDPTDDAAHPHHADRARLRPGRRRPAPADPARAGARARVRLGQRRLVARPPAPRAAEHRDGRVLLDRRARRRRHRLRRARRRAEARGAVGRHRDAVPGRRDLARQGPPRAPARRAARRGARRADPLGDHPGAVGVPERAARRARRRPRAGLGHHRPGARARGAVDRRAGARRRTGG